MALFSTKTVLYPMALLSTKTLLFRKSASKSNNTLLTLTRNAKKGGKTQKYWQYKEWSPATSNRVSDVDWMLPLTFNFVVCMCSFAFTVWDYIYLPTCLEPTKECVSFPPTCKLCRPRCGGKKCMSNDECNRCDPKRCIKLMQSK